jgi:hypothetical protein
MIEIEAAINRLKPMKAPSVCGFHNCSHNYKLLSFDAFCRVCGLHSDRTRLSLTDPQFHCSHGRTLVNFGWQRPPSDDGGLTEMGNYYWSGTLLVVSYIFRHGELLFTKRWCVGDWVLLTFTCLPTRSLPIMSHCRCICICWYHIWPVERGLRRRVGRKVRRLVTMCLFAM